MTNKFHLSSLALLIGGIVLSGCASKQIWSPELEDAREVFATVSSDPMVATRAVSELQAAKRQLEIAEEASDFFKSREEIAHQAMLAKLKTFEAQETARAIAAKENLRLAESDNSFPVVPTLASALPEPARPQYGITSDTNQQVAQQLETLTQQIKQLQSQVEIASTQQVGGYSQLIDLGRDYPIQATIQPQELVASHDSYELADTVTYTTAEVSEPASIEYVDQYQSEEARLAASLASSDWY